MERKNLILILTALILSLLLLETSVRLFLPATPLHTGHTLNSDHLIDQALQRTKEKPPEKPVPVRIKTGREHILTSPTFDSTEKFLKTEAERWGNTDTNKTKILIIGDSHTELMEGYDLAWYDYLETEFQDTELFTVGLTGAGATQEYLLLNQSIEIINPDIVLWQFCPNDYRNDNYEKNRAYWPLTHLGIPPYLIDDGIEYKLISPLPGLRRNSKTVDFVLSKSRARAIHNPETFSGKLAKRYFFKHHSPDYEPTERMIEKAINRTKNQKSEFYLIKISGPENRTDEYGVCRNIDISCIKGTDRYVFQKAEENNITVNRGDDHWTEEANRMAGKYLVQYFKNHSIIETSENTKPQ